MFLNKNIIVGFENHVFTKLYIDVLIRKCSIKEEDIVLISLSESDQINHLKGTNVKLVNYRNVDPAALVSCKTVTSISLSLSNAPFLKSLLECSDKFIGKLYIHLTDDEVARWLKTIDKHGSLIQTRNNQINEDCLFVLSKVINFIAPEPYFRPSLEKILKRQELNFYDARDAFKSMPSELWDEFECMRSKFVEETQAENKILIGAKADSFTVLEVLSIIYRLGMAGVLNQHKLLVFVKPKRVFSRLVIDTFLALFKMKCVVDISYVTPTNNINYNALFMSCSDIILQGRGSMSTARSYVSGGTGRIHVKDGSPNFIEMVEAEGISVCSYNTLTEIPLSFDHSLKVDEKNQKIMKNRFLHKYQVLNKIYS
ncbi:hypothetical protein AB6D04_11240 [Vibrio splendidus]|uniref:hypothetical protein n=1 Tax=Vibrio splendidus TaxID=29497 RepID=UPI000C828DCC|nr:hypothetical protein [Vibrio splendidus]PMN78510.1 hypothetical protein BCT24_04815 [Vibrio splendidus]